MYSLLIKALAQKLSSDNHGPRLGILTYHRVLPLPDPLRPYEPTAKSFDAQLRLLRHTFNILRLDKAVDLLQQGRLPARALAITFDDGYKDNHDIALPILQRHGVAATFFVATGFMQDGAMFNDIVIEAIRQTRCQSICLPWSDAEAFPLASMEQKRAAIEVILPIVKKQPPELRNQRVRELTEQLQVPPPVTLMMPPADVQALHRAGMEIGGHTVNHPILLSLSDAEASKEITVGKETLEALLQEPIRGFAYPNGRPGRDYDQRHPQLVRQAGFDYAVSTRWASCRGDTDRFELPRVAPSASNAAMFAVRVARAYRD